MSLDHPIIGSLAAAYLLGSIPFGYILVRIIYGGDVRQTGSGNIGATNVSRTSPQLGAITLSLDALKGLAAVALALTWTHGNRELAFAAAFTAICGHVFPVWLGFRGGKGVATGLGSFLLLTPKAVLICILIFLGIFAAFRWVALASIVATASLPPIAWILGEVHGLTGQPGESLLVFVLLCGAAILIVAKHHTNIRRMIAGTESRFNLGNK